MSKGRWTVTLTAISLVGSGCYRSLELEQVPAPGSRVEVVLTPEARESLRLQGITFVDYLNSTAGALEATVVMHTEDSTVVQIPSTHIVGFVGGTLHQRVTLLPSDVDAMRRRVVNAPLTLGVLAGAGAILTNVVMTIFDTVDCPSQLQVCQR